ncbi:hypothetical protein B0H13DRAFT_2405520 [Mycena leptocephala]|nr:hypothetical protein B0H13DRAFT_2405520 [Mycena leptocephala]
MAPLGRRPRLCVACAPPPLAPRPPNALSPPPPAAVPPSLQPLVEANPFTPFFLLSHPTPAPDRPELVPTMQLCLKGPGDLVPLVYSVVLFSFLRLVLSHSLFPMLARKWGIRKAGKVARFGEQGYAVVYLLVVGVWGVYTLSTTPVSSTLNPLTAHFWIDYPHNHFSAMKRYYLSQIAYWLQQALFFSPRRTHVRVSTGGWLARRMRMRGVCGPPVAHLPDRTRSWVWDVANSRRAVLLPMVLPLGRASFPDPNPVRVPSASLGAILATLNRMQGIEMRALYESWACICAAARRSIPVSVLVPVRALASVDRFAFLFACRRWRLLGRHRVFPAFLFGLVFFSVPFMICALPKRCSDNFEFVLHLVVDCWLDSEEELEDDHPEPELLESDESDDVSESSQSPSSHSSASPDIAGWPGSLNFHSNGFLV